MNNLKLRIKLMEELELLISKYNISRNDIDKITKLIQKLTKLEVL